MTNLIKIRPHAGHRPIDRANMPAPQPRKETVAEPLLHRSYTQLIRGHIHLENGLENGMVFIATADIEPPFYAPDPFTGQQGVAAGKEARIWGDPHVEEADGGRFDFQGEAGKIYNLLNDSGVQINARFQSYSEGTTTIGEIGAIVSGPGGTSIIRINSHEDPPVRVDGRPLVPGESVRLADGGSLALSADGRTITFSTREGYQNTVTVQGEGPNAYLDYSVRSSGDGVTTDGRMPGGVVGHTFDGNNLARNGRTGSGAQGEGAIDGVYTDYEIDSGIFGSPQPQVMKTGAFQMPVVWDSNFQDYFGIPVGTSFAMIPAEEIEGLWRKVAEDSNAQLARQLGNESFLTENEKTKRLEMILEIALNSGNIELAMLLLSSLETRSANNVVQGLMGKMRELQTQRREIAEKIGKIDSKSATGSQEATQLQMQAGDIGTEMSMLQTFLQDVSAQKNEAQQMASNFLKSRHETAMGIVRNIG